MTHDALGPWRIDAAAYPRGGIAQERWRFLAGYAILAPSGHNTQPWRLRIRGDRLEILADRTRRLPVVDPHDRALVISCGAAIACVEAALRALGHASEVALLPDPDEPDLLASIGFGDAHTPTPDEEARARAIVARRTTRLRFPEEPLPEGLTERLNALAQRRDVALALVVAPEAKARIGALVAEGDRAQFADPAFRRELAAWIQSRRVSGDGISGAAFGMPDVLSPVGSLVIRTFDMGDGLAAKDAEIAAGSPALLVLSTAQDTPHDWLRAGAAHLDILLEVTAAGLTAAYLNQPIEVDALRPRLDALVGSTGAPQLLLRIGRAKAITPAARRPVEAVLDRAS